jgi:hypothetical protein
MVNAWLVPLCKGCSPVSSHWRLYKPLLFFCMPGKLAAAFIPALTAQVENDPAKHLQN